MNRRTLDDATLGRCLAELGDLKSLSGTLGTTLHEASDDLIKTGRPPTRQLLDNLLSFRAAVESLKSRAMQAGDELNLDGRLRGEMSLSEIERELKSQSLIQSTLRQLAQIPLIRHIEQKEIDSLKCCTDEASRLREELMIAPTSVAILTAEKFLSGQVPLGAVVMLVSEGPKLSDERWSVLLESVSTAYGREISTAIARGKLILQPSSKA